MDLLQSLLPLLTPIGLALFALLIVREGQKDRAAENLRRDTREDAERDRQAKNDERFMLLFATITNKQTEGTASVTKSVVDSESRTSNQLTSAENNIKGRISASADASAASFEKLYRIVDTAFKIELARPPDPAKAIRYDKALEILTAQMEAVSADLEGVKTNVATNTETGAANTAAITDAATALAAVTPAPVADAPAPVIIADVSEAAIASIAAAVTTKADAGDEDTSEDKLAS